MLQCTSSYTQVHHHQQNSCVMCCSVCCSSLQFVAVCCNVYHHKHTYIIINKILAQCVAVQHTATQCNALECVAVCCSVSQCMSLHTHVHRHQQDPCAMYTAPDPVVDLYPLLPSVCAVRAETTLQILCPDKQCTCVMCCSVK